jgi:sulfide dehydrogenase cytochrome subunit
VSRVPIGLAALLLGLALGGGDPSRAGAAEPDTALMAAACTSCHGEGGRSPTAIPALAGKAEADLLAALREYRSGARAGTIMPRLAKGYSDAQLAALAAWYGGRQ